MTTTWCFITALLTFTLYIYLLALALSCHVFCAMTDMYKDYVIIVFFLHAHTYTPHCSLKRELEKVTNEKNEIHRHYIMVCAWWQRLSGYVYDITVIIRLHPYCMCACAHATKTV